MFAKTLALFAAGATALSTHDVASLSPSDEILTLYDQTKMSEAEKARVSKAFNDAFDSFAEQWPAKEWESFLQQTESALVQRADTYRLTPSASHCDRGAAPTAPTLAGVAAFPGGIVKRFPGFSLSKLIFNLSQRVGSAAAAESASAGPLQMAAIGQGLGLVQAVASAALMVVPPLISPPMFWNNQPLNCVPMVSGHNCLGAVLRPITMADFAVADVTDRQLDGVIADFPSLYRSKIGKTSDTAYHLCFSQLMGLKCASLFPACTVPQARNEPTPVGRMSMCVTHCVSTLVACPGFWLDDVADECMDVSVPPACTFALFLNVWRAPPQLVDFEDSEPVSTECPESNAELDAGDASGDLQLYSPSAVAASPYASAGAAGAVRVPNA